MSSPLRSALAVLAGFVLMSVVAGICFVVVFRTMDVGLQPTPGYLLVNIGYWVVAALLGGWATAQLAPERPMQHAYVLAAATLVTGIVLHVSSQRAQPAWYQTLIVLLGPLAAVAGATLSVRRRIA